MPALHPSFVVVGVRHHNQRGMRRTFVSVLLCTLLACAVRCSTLPLFDQYPLLWTFGRASDVITADIDGDNLPDVIFSAPERENPQLVLYRNLDNGVLGPP